MSTDFAQRLDGDDSELFLFGGGEQEVEPGLYKIQYTLYDCEETWNNLYQCSLDLSVFDVFVSKQDVVYLDTALLTKVVYVLNECTYQFDSANLLERIALHSYELVVALL